MKNNYLKIKILLLFAFSSFQIFSQGMVSKETVLKHAVENSKLIIEGKVLSKGKSFRATNNAIYTAYEVQSDKVIYGASSGSKINLIVEGGEIEENGMMIGTTAPHGLEVKLNMASTIFCQPFTNGNLPNSYFLVEQVCYNANNEIITTNSLSEYYKDINELYKDLSKQLNIQITEKKSPDVNESAKILDFDLTPYSEKLNNYNNHIAFFTSRLNDQLNQKTSKVLTNDLTISTDNEQITSSGSTKFFEFDVVVRANTTGLFFDNCLLRIKYNQTSFGQNVVAYNNVTITKGTLFNSATYINPQANAIDQGVDVMGIPFGIDYTQSSFNRTPLTTTDKILLHIKMKIQYCNQPSDIQFVDVSTTSNLSFYTTTANAPATSGNSFDNTTYNSPPTLVLCTVLIDDFNTLISGGVGTTLTITGFNFGATRGNGKVRFKNANKVNFPYLDGLDNNDYISWSNTEIKINLPSSTILNGYYNNPGSGAFIVKNNVGDSAVSFINTASETFKVHYSVDTRFSGSDKFKLNLKNENGIGGYTIRLDTSISNYPERKGCIVKAIRDWRCLSGANLVLGPDANIYPPTNDGITTIAFTPSMSSGQVAATFVQYQVCGAAPNIKVAIPDFDIQASRQYNFFYDTTGQDLPQGMYDFYEAMVHEIGHGLGLLHVIDQSQIMYRTTMVSTNGVSLAGVLRRRLQIYSGDADGGLFQVTSSPAAVYGQCTNFSSHTLVNSSCSQVGIFENSKNKYDFSVYPNPTNGDIVNINFNIPVKSAAKINVCDVTGRILYSVDVPSRVSENNSYTLNLNGFAEGLYFINLNIDGNNFSQKTIKN